MAEHLLEMSILQRRLAEVEAEMTRLQMKVATLQAEHATLQAQHATLQAEHAALRAENAKLRAENATLRCRLGLDSHNSHKPLRAMGSRRSVFNRPCPKGKNVRVVDRRVTRGTVVLGGRDAHLSAGIVCPTPSLDGGSSRSRS
ncbi:MAG: hypothetical protein ACK8QZ_00345 [Anaerolineales bacterium]